MFFYIYSYDNRGGSSEPQHWSNDSLFKGRAAFELDDKAVHRGRRVAFLRLRTVDWEDRGIFKCRVDYRQARTTTSSAELGCCRNLGT